MAKERIAAALLTAAVAGSTMEKGPVNVVQACAESPHTLTMDRQQINRTPVFDGMALRFAGLENVQLSSHVDGPFGIPSSISTETRVSAQGIPYASNFIRAENTGNAWKTTPAEGGRHNRRFVTDYSQVVRLAEEADGRVWQIGSSESKGRFSEVTIEAPSEWLVFMTVPFGDVRLLNYDVSWNVKEREHAEAKFWLNDRESCGGHKIVIANGPEGDVIVQGWPLQHGDGVGKLRESQLRQYIQNARVGGINDLALEFFVNETKESLRLESNPQIGSIDFVSTNGTR